MRYIDKDFFIPVLDEGDKIYHYTSAEGLKGICNGEFWVTEQHFLNDSSEFQVGTEMFLFYLFESIRDIALYREMKKRILNQMKSFDKMGKIGDQAAFSGDYVISFCLDEDSPLLWSEYSDFMGYCMKFDFNRLLKAFNDKVYFHGRVVYNRDEQLECINKSIEYILSKYEDCDCSTEEYLNSINNDNMDEFISWATVVCSAYNMFFKRPCFEGEHEYRFIFACAHDGGRYKAEQLEKLFFRIKEETFIPFVKKEIKNLDCLESVLVGPKNKSDIAVKGLEYFFRNKKLKVAIEKSEMPLRY